MTRLTAWLIMSALGASAVLVFSGYLYVYVMYDNHFTRESVAEGASYAMQTVTTVGYGTWEHPARQHEETREHQNRILRMRAYSVGFMFFGATFYTILTGVVVSGLNRNT